jgi:type II secretion system protein N
MLLSPFKLLSPAKLKYLRWLGYVGGYLLAFIFFAYVSFPYDRLKQYLVTSYNAAQSGVAANRLEIDSLSWSWRFPGLSLEGVRLVVPPAPVLEGEKPSPPQYLEAEDAYVSASALGLLTGTREASFGASALGGYISGWVSDSEASRRLELSLDGVNPGAVPQLSSAIGLPLSGQLSGHVSLDLPEGNVTRAEGNVELAGEDLVLGDGKAKIQNTIALPELHMGAFTLKGSIAAGRLKLDECTARGRDVELALTGGVRLRPRLETSMADLELKFSFADKYKAQSETTKAIFGQPDSKIPGLFDAATGASLSKQEDGSYAARLTGAIAKIKPRPLVGRRSRADSGSSARPRSSRAASSRRAARAGNADSEGEEPAEDDAENVE